MAIQCDLTRPWEIWLVHHTHVDIGYTDAQEAILRKQADFIAQALDYCAATDALPPGERFCWTCEVAWTVKAFLARYPERATEFFRRVREGRVEVTALYLQLTDLFTRELLEETTDYALELGRRHGFEVVTAMNDDVNGWAWGLPDLLTKRGVRYMDTAINETRALGVLPRPAIFRWIGPQGGSLLFWHSHGYLTGNGLGLDRPGAGERAIAFLKSLETGGYPHQVVEVRIHGENHDNAPPGLWLSEMVQAWNSAHASPKLRLVTPRTWFEEVSAHWPAPIIEHRAAWPDWWADGSGSAAAETALARRAQADLVALKSMAAATGRLPAADRVERTRDAAAFFCEHTWGAWCSTDLPDSLISRAQWNAKAGFAYAAAVEAKALVRDQLADEARKKSDGKPGIFVFNPLDRVRSDIVELTVADADLGLPAANWVPAPARSEPGPAFYLADAEKGGTIPVVREPAIADSARRPAQCIRFLARDLPARGFRRYSVVAGDIPEAGTCEIRADGMSSPTLDIGICERGIAAVREKASGADWLSGEMPFTLGEVIYETIPGPSGREKLCGWSGIRRDCSFNRAPLRFAAPEPIRLPYGAGLRLTARELPGSLRSLVLYAIIYDDLPRLDLRYRLDKIPNAEAEALYIAFPLASAGRNAAQTEVWLDIPGAVMRPGIDQVAGTATDWHSVQHYFAVARAGSFVTVATPDIPLVQVNGINTGKWQETLSPHNGIVMSWVMNNYWFTNFPAAQGGAFEWRYSLRLFPGKFDSRAAADFARAIRHPAIAEVMP